MEQRARKHDKASEKAVQELALSKQWVLAKLVENVERGLQARAVLDDEGKPIGEYSYQGNVVNRALELLGKEQGMFIDRKEMGAPGEFANLTSAAEVIDVVRKELGDAMADALLSAIGKPADLDATRDPETPLN